MSLINSLLKMKRLDWYSGILLVAVYATFASSHLLSFQRTHDWPLLLFCFSETLTVTFLLFRTKSKAVSDVLSDWFVAIGCTFAPLLLRPASWGVVPLGKFLIVAGILVQIAGLISLNRSIAIVAARRDIKTSGMYRVVRHPLYASYVLMYTGYLLQYTSVSNLLIYVVTLLFLSIRSFREERILAEDAEYRDYMQRVNYRMIPYVF